MQLAHRVSLGGVQLDEIDPRIIIKGIDGGAGKETTSTVSAGAGDGTRITCHRRDSMEVAVRFSMMIRRNLIEERGEVLEAIGAWAARGGYLRINYKPNRRLLVDEIVIPGEGDLWKRFSEYTITFRAHAVPYWEENSAVSAVTGSGTTGSGSIEIAGSVETVADAILANVSGATINNVSITVGGKTMAFTGIGMGAGQSLTIDHVVRNKKLVMRARVGSTSVMAMRSDASADDYNVQPGACSFSFAAQRACRLTVSSRGRFV